MWRALFHQNIKKCEGNFQKCGGKELSAGLYIKVYGLKKHILKVFVAYQNL